MGSMVDFLRANPYVTREEYLWEWTVPQVRLASLDFTHTEYLKEGQAAEGAPSTKSYDDPADFMNDMGMPVIAG